MESNKIKFVIILWSFSEWETIVRNPMIKALAKNLEGIANILYVCSPFSPIVTFFLSRERYIRNREKKSLEKTSENLYIFRPKKLLTQYAYNKLGIQKIYYKWLGERVKEALRLLDWSDYKRISWINYPHQIGQLDIIDEDLVVYECYDEYRSFSEDKRKNIWMSNLEDKLLEKADVVFTTSAPLYESRKKMHPNVFLTPNGLDFEFFQEKINNSEILDDIVNIPRPIIGYIGNLMSWLDFSLLEYVANKKPECSFVFIGHLDNNEGARQFIARSRQRDIKNIYILGEKEHRHIPSYIKNFDIAVIPFKMCDFCDCINPLKLWEYLAVGKPVISTYLKNLEPLKDLIFLVNSPEEFVNHIGVILKNLDSDFLKERINRGEMLAKEHSWENITKPIATLLSEYSNKESKGAK